MNEYYEYYEYYEYEIKTYSMIEIWYNRIIYLYQMMPYHNTFLKKKVVPVLKKAIPVA
jgi:hypothetical protein